MKISSRAILGTFVFALAAVSNAQIALESVGTWATSPDPTIAWTQSEDVIQSASFTAPYAQLDTLSVNVAAAFPLALAVYSNLAGTDTLSMEWDITGFTEFNGGFSMSGDWLEIGGTGTYANTAGGGTFAVTQLVPGAYSGTVLVGNLQSVPEPGSYAVLGIGAAGLFLRRRKK